LDRDRCPQRGGGVATKEKGYTRLYQRAKDVVVSLMPPRHH
jgi:hypothetical protein